MLKYTHSSPIQRVKYNPLSIMLASCSDNDFGIWTPEQKQVTKEKTTSKILSVSWTSDGTLVALGMQSGVISIRNQQAEEKMRVERKAPIWCLSFIPNYGTTGKGAQTKGTSQGLNTPEQDTLIVGCWDKSLLIYKIQGNSIKLQGEKSLNYYPCSIALAGASIGNKLNYLVVSGSHKKVTLYSRDGARLADVITKDSWVWSCACNANLDTVVSGTDFGAIDTMQMTFDAVHALYRDRYAYRENLTEIIVHHLITDRKVRIKCKDLVRRVSLYKNKLAVQLTDRVCIYESNIEDSTDMHFRSKEKIILGNKPCESIAVTSQHLLFCSGTILELYSVDGKRQRMWQLESPVRYMRVDGGPEGREGVILGLENGFVLKVYIDNPFPLDLTKVKSPVISVSMSIYRSKLACVDSSNVLTITDLRTQEVLYTQNDVISACFNTEIDGMLCYTTTSFVMNVLSGLPSSFEDAKDKTSDSSKGISEPQQQYTTGFAIGFQGQKIYYLNRGVISSVDVPQGLNLQKALDQGDIYAAHSVACLGATEAEWKILAMRALRANCIPVAKSSFARIKEIKYLTLIEAIERGYATNEELKKNSTINSSTNDRKGRQRGDSNQPSTTVKSGLGPLDPVWQAEILAYEGHHHEAAKMYAKAGKYEEAMRLFIDMRRWQDAKAFAQAAGHMDQTTLTMQQAKWLQEINDWKSAAELYSSMNQYFQAAKIVVDAFAAGETGWQPVLIEVVRSAPAEGNAETFNLCGDAFSKADEDEYARETYKKLGDVSKLMTLYIRRQMWTEAAALAETNESQCDMSVFLPYAEWLVSTDRYEDAMQAYKKAGRKDLARKVLEELTINAVSETRFKDAAYYYWMLSKEADGEDHVLQSEYEHKADLYYAYSSIHTFITSPFTSYQADMLFQVSRFIINSLGSSDSIPSGISKASTLYTLAKQAMKVGAYKLARHAYDRLSKLQVPAKKQEEIELDALIVQARPVSDDKDYLPTCFRCFTVNPLLNPFTKYKGDVCTSCGHPFVRSFINFEILPLVEFVPEPSISDEEAIELIRQSSSSSGSITNKKGGRHGGSESKVDNADVLTFGEDEGKSNFGSSKGPGDQDLFARCMNHAIETQDNNYCPVTVNVKTLIAMNRTEVFVCRPSSKQKRCTFYKNMLPDISIAISQSCHRFFHLEDFEFAYLSEQACPYSRLKNVGEYGSL